MHEGFRPDNWNTNTPAYKNWALHKTHSCMHTHPHIQTPFHIYGQLHDETECRVCECERACCWQHILNSRNDTKFEALETISKAEKRMGRLCILFLGTYMLSLVYISEHIIYAPTQLRHTYMVLLSRFLLCPIKYLEIPFDCRRPWRGSHWPIRME